MTSGKTHLTLEGLCHNWGFYISCRLHLPESLHQKIGSFDFSKAIGIMESMSKWDNGTGMSETIITKNVAVANCVFAMLICARVFVLKNLLKELPKDVDVMVAQW